MYEKSLCAGIWSSVLLAVSSGCLYHRLHYTSGWWSRDLSITMGHIRCETPLPIAPLEISLISFLGCLQIMRVSQYNCTVMWNYQPKERFLRHHPLKHCSEQHSNCTSLNFESLVCVYHNWMCITYMYVCIIMYVYVCVCTDSIVRLSTYSCH